MSRLLAALVVLTCAPLTALAEGEPSNPVATPTADWNIGGGLGYSSYIYWSSADLDNPSHITQFMPSVTASLERRLSGRTWLAFGVAGSFSRREDDVAPGYGSWEHSDLQQLYFTAGVRHVLTGNASPVDVSLLVLAEGGSTRREDRGTFSGSEVEVKESGWLAGGSLGIAVDRELTRGLSLRVATPLVEASYVEGRVEKTGQPVRTGTAVSATVVIAPRLELRLAF